MIGISNSMLFSQNYMLDNLFKVNDYLFHEIKKIKIDSEGNIYSVSVAYDTIINKTVLIISKTDSLNRFLWGKKIHTSGLLRPTTMKLDSYDNLYLTTTFNDYLIYNDSTDNSVKEGILISSYSKNGQLRWQNIIGGYLNYIWEIDFDTHNNMYFTLTNRFGNNIIFDTLTFNGLNNYLVKYNNQGKIMFVNQIGNYFSSSSGISVFEDKLYISGTFFSTFQQDSVFFAERSGK